MSPSLPNSALIERESARYEQQVEESAFHAVSSGWWALTRLERVLNVRGRQQHHVAPAQRFDERDGGLAALNVGAGDLAARNGGGGERQRDREG